MGTYCSLSGLSGDDIIEFVSIVNRSLEEADAELGRRHRNYRNVRESMPDMDRYITESELADEGFGRVCCVPFVNGALLVAAYNYFEDSITRICREAYQGKLVNKKVPTNFNIEKAQSYLKMISFDGRQFDMAVLGDGWSEIYHGWRLLRHNLVHGNKKVAQEEISQPTPEEEAALFPRMARMFPRIFNRPLTGAKNKVQLSKHAHKIRRFVKNRPGLSVRDGDLVVEKEAVKDFVLKAQEVIDDVEREVERIASKMTTTPSRPR